MLQVDLKLPGVCRQWIGLFFSIMLLFPNDAGAQTFGLFEYRVIENNEVEIVAVKLPGGSTV